MYVYIHTYINTYIHTYIHTYTHTHTHLQTQLKVWQKRAAHIQENVVLADPEVVQPPLTTETPRLRFLTLNITLGNIVTYAENVVVVKRRDQVINRFVGVDKIPTLSCHMGTPLQNVKCIHYNYALCRGLLLIVHVNSFLEVS